DYALENPSPKLIMKCLDILRLGSTEEFVESRLFEIFYWQCQTSISLLRSYVSVKLILNHVNLVAPGDKRLFRVCLLLAIEARYDAIVELIPESTPPITAGIAELVSESPIAGAAADGKAPKKADFG